eukprot:CAMPEP_0174841574 /NCGR_PEP_ID=MMETSP1114-20130205/9405_1 /TAXON_ID=312471 /ORGANISM="Neobodo designis, Strain CCAP 1951/1" /LENGTH=384 /DNA_ID=CAMNT_0016075765 /DNA_START=32 /DNA_END=1186 /DNA_ORIENTATION=+
MPGFNPGKFRAKQLAIADSDEDSDDVVESAPACASAPEPSATCATPQHAGDSAAAEPSTAEPATAPPRDARVEEAPAAVDIEPVEEPEQAARQESHPADPAATVDAVPDRAAAADPVTETATAPAEGAPPTLEPAADDEAVADAEGSERADSVENRREETADDPPSTVESATTSDLDPAAATATFPDTQDDGTAEGASPLLNEDRVDAETAGPATGCAGPVEAASDHEDDGGEADPATAPAPAARSQQAEAGDTVEQPHEEEGGPSDPPPDMKLPPPVARPSSASSASSRRGGNVFSRLYNPANLQARRKRTEEAERERVRAELAKTAENLTFHPRVRENPFVQVQSRFQYARPLEAHDEKWRQKWLDRQAERDAFIDPRAGRF